MYSLGSTLYALLNGTAPFESSNPAAVLKRLLFEPPAPLAGVPEELAMVIFGALEKDAERRIPTALAFGQQLQAVQQRLGQVVTELPVTAQAAIIDPPIVRARVRAAGAVAVLSDPGPSVAPLTVPDPAAPSPATGPSHPPTAVDTARRVRVRPVTAVARRTSRFSTKRMILPTLGLMGILGVAGYRLARPDRVISTPLPISTTGTPLPISTTGRSVTLRLRESRTAPNAPVCGSRIISSRFFARSDRMP